MAVICVLLGIVVVGTKWIARCNHARSSFFLLCAVLLSVILGTCLRLQQRSRLSVCLCAGSYYVAVGNPVRPFHCCLPEQKLCLVQDKALSNGYYDAIEDYNQHGKAAFLNAAPNFSIYLRATNHSELVAPQFGDFSSWVRADMLWLLSCPMP
jgi:hypothetical protein